MLRERKVIYNVSLKSTMLNTAVAAKTSLARKGGRGESFCRHDDFRLRVQTISPPFHGTCRLLLLPLVCFCLGCLVLHIWQHPTGILANEELGY